MVPPHQVQRSISQVKYNNTRTYKRTPSTQYNVYIGSGGSQPADSAMWLQSGISGSNAAQPAIGASVLLADGATTMPSGEVNPAILAVSLTAAPATSGTALSTVSANTAKTFVDGSGNVLMWDGIIAQALNNASQANGATLGAQMAQPASADGKLALADIENLLAGMYLQAAGDPDFIAMNPLDNVRLTNLVVAAGQLRYVLQVGDSGDQGQLTAQYWVTCYLNKSTGKEIQILLEPLLPAGAERSRNREFLGACAPSLAFLVMPLLSQDRLRLLATAGLLGEVS